MKQMQKMLKKNQTQNC